MCRIRRGRGKGGTEEQNGGARGAPEAEGIGGERVVNEEKRLEKNARSQCQYG